MLLKCVLLFVLVVSVTSEECTYSSTINGITYQISGGSYISPMTYPFYEVRKGAVPNILEMRSLTMSGVRRVEPGAFQNLSNLTTYLSFHDCMLTTISAGIFSNLKNVEILAISSCHIESIAPDAFENMTSLRSLYLENDHLTRIDPSWFSNLPALYIIQITHNFIKEIPADVIPDIDGNKTFWLNFERNNIKRIHDDAFRKLKKIYKLNLNGNELETFNGKSLRDLWIQELGLEKNKIVCLDERDFDKIFVATTTTNVTGNPWDSQCLDKIVKWAEDNGKNIRH